MKKILIIFIFLFLLSLTSCTINDNIKNFDYIENKEYILKKAIYTKDNNQLNEEEIKLLPINKQTKFIFKKEYNKDEILLDLGTNQFLYIKDTKIKSIKHLKHFSYHKYVYNLEKLENNDIKLVLNLLLNKEINKLNNNTTFYIILNKNEVIKDEVLLLFEVNHE